MSSPEQSHSSSPISILIPKAIHRCRRAVQGDALNILRAYSAATTTAVAVPGDVHEDFTDNASYVQRVFNQDQRDE